MRAAPSVLQGIGDRLRLLRMSLLDGIEGESDRRDGRDGKPELGGNSNVIDGGAIDDDVMAVDQRNVPYAISTSVAADHPEEYYRSVGRSQQCQFPPQALVGCRVVGLYHSRASTGSAPVSMLAARPTGVDPVDATGKAVR